MYHNTLVLFINRKIVSQCSEQWELGRFLIGKLPKRDSAGQLLDQTHLTRKILIKGVKNKI